MISKGSFISEAFSRFYPLKRLQQVIYLLFILLMQCTNAAAQIFPAENSSLNYRLAGFSFPPIAGVNVYTVEVAVGNYNADSTFQKNIYKRLPSSENRIIVELPSFGREYTWRTAGSSKGKISTGKLHHFNVAIADEVDTNVTRLVVLKAAETYKDAHVLLDGSIALYNMDGNPLWYLPLTGKLARNKNKIMDLKLTPQGTITFLMGQKIFEVDYNGKLLWEGPDNDKNGKDTSAHYHHEFTRLRNGNYMVLGNEFITMKVPQYKAATGEKLKTADTSSKNVAAFGTIVEYDPAGKIVWSWRSAEYFKTVPAEFLKSDLYDPLAPQGTEDVHENAFYFDEKERVIYVSFKNISTILKVKYPEGNVTDAYGKLATLTKSGNTSQPFCGQHSCKLTTDGKLYLYNNNTCHKGELPQILMFDEPETAADTLKLVWAYTCNFDDVIARKQYEQAGGEKVTLPAATTLSAYSVFSKGSNLIKLPNHSIFANICGPYGKTFILSPEKNIQWSALLETWNPYQKKWDDVIYYKANIITDPNDLSRLIWKSQGNVR